ncbi:hypothetical protein CLOSYM_01193 [[Clostridium] symbiosum ATCC 14940]|uniref:Uncharacterized protein n=1 Tax=[Clostridium] symbiosum ATCC 14940 TaxID=411472 RepID=A0ABC9U0Z4_CLOSY|nr:hypothetical protein CLOSYM_01193 [[Clostridium] symbiosum ATCC 14940]
MRIYPADSLKNETDSSGSLTVKGTAMCNIHNVNSIFLIFPTKNYA